MNADPMSAGERLAAAMSHREADRCPFVLSVTMHGARELGLSIQEYYANPEHVAEGQLRMRARYGHDALVPGYYGAVEYEAWGGEVLFREDGPPNSGAPLIQSVEQIVRLSPPEIPASPCLCRALRAIELLKARVGDTVPIMGGVIAPTSLPVMQLGFDPYLEVLCQRPALYERLMRLNEEFCVAWANAQLAAGASAIGYADPVSSPSISSRELWLRTGYPVAQRTIARIRGPVAMHFASGRSLAAVDDVARLGVVGISASALEDLSAVKAACRGRLTVLGNLNAIEMRRWDAAQAEAAVKTALAQAGPGGGYILTDNHGEIPWQVPESVLEAVSAAALEWGRYPLDWAAAGPPAPAGGAR